MEKLSNKSPIFMIQVI